MVFCCTTFAVSCASIAYPALVGWIPSQNKNSSTSLQVNGANGGRHASRSDGCQIERRRIRDDGAQELVGIEPRDADSGKHER